MAHHFFLAVLIAKLSLAQSVPNIIIFQCDEMDGRVLDPHHQLSKVTRMPNLEKLTRSGVNFVNAYTNCPLCAPSRASMFTGRRVSSIKSWSNIKPLTVDVSSFPPTQADPACANIIGYGWDRCLEMGAAQNVTTTMNLAMQASGYNVLLQGKMDTGGGPVMAPLRAVAPGGYHDKGWWRVPIGFQPQDYTTYIAGGSLHAWAQGANISKPQMAPLDGPNGWIDIKKFNTHKKDWRVVKDCAEMIRTWKTGDPPVFLYCSILNPHPPYTSNKFWEASVNKRELFNAIANIAKTYVPRSQVHPADLYSSMVEGIPFDFNWTLTERLTLAYFSQCAIVDGMFGKLLDAVHESQASENTYIFFISDHGEMHLEHRLMQKMSMYEGSARVPFIVTGPGVPRNKQVTDPISLIDLFPTVLDIAQAPNERFETLQGHSLAPYIGVLPNRTISAQRSDFAVVEYFGEFVNTPHFMVRSGDFKYITYGPEPPYHKYPPQLFDVKSDPLELNNLASKDDKTSLILELDDKLRSVVDYPKVTRQQNEENRENVRRWMAAHPHNRWKTLLQTAYFNFDPEEDFQRFHQWFNETGEFAPLCRGLVSASGESSPIHCGDTITSVKAPE